jgi:hypothetical protein
MGACTMGSRMPNRSHSGVASTLLFAISAPFRCCRCEPARPLAAGARPHSGAQRRAGPAVVRCPWPAACSPVPKSYQYGDRLARRNRSQRFGRPTVPTAILAKERQDPRQVAGGVRRGPPAARPEDRREASLLPGCARVVVAHEQGQPTKGCPRSCSSPKTLTYLSSSRGTRPGNTKSPATSPTGGHPNTRTHT